MYTKLKLKVFEKFEKKIEYLNSVDEKLKSRDTTNKTLNQNWETLKSALIKSAEQVCGRRRIGDNKKE